MKNKIAVVFSTNKGFAMYTHIAIFTMLEHVNKDFFYDIRVFITDNAEKEKKMLETLSRDCATVTCMDVSEYVGDADLRGINNISKETFYRLFIPIIIPEYERIIYLDSDLIVLSDVSKLMDIDLEGYALAASRDVVSEFIQNHAKIIGMNDANNMFNSGVMVINSKEYERQNIRDMALELIYQDYMNTRRKYQFPDQDVLNALLEGKIKYLDSKWNVLAYFKDNINEIIEEDDRKSYMENIQNPYIVHFAGPRKPWNDIDLAYSNIFWEKSLEAGCFYEILGDIIEKEKKNRHMVDCFKGFRFPYERVNAGSKVALYGAGVVGHVFYDQLMITQFAYPVLWVDRNFEKIDKKFNVTAVENLVTMIDEYDCLVIAIEKRNIADKIKTDLCKMGIPTTKIIWTEYNRESL